MLKDRTDLILALLVLVGIFLALWAGLRAMGIDINLSVLSRH